MGERNTELFLLTDIILLIVFVGTILLSWNFSQKYLLIELAMLFILLFFAIVSAVALYFKVRVGSIILSLVYSILLINLLLIYWKKGSASHTILFLTMLLSLFGFVTSVTGIKKRPSLAYEEKIVNAVDEPSDYVKYVASNTGLSYHLPDCVLAKKIKKENLVSHNTEEEAKEKGLKPHSCVKK